MKIINDTLIHQKLGSGYLDRDRGVTLKVMGLTSDSKWWG